MVTGNEDFLLLFSSFLDMILSSSMCTFADTAFSYEAAAGINLLLLTYFAAKKLNSVMF